MAGRLAPGQVFAVYLAGTSAARFVVDFFRAHDSAPPFGGPLSIAQWVSLALAAAALFLFRRSPVSPAPGNTPNPPVIRT